MRRYWSLTLGLSAGLLTACGGAQTSTDSPGSEDSDSADGKEDGAKKNLRKLLGRCDKTYEAAPKDSQLDMNIAQFALAECVRTAVTESVPTFARALEKAGSEQGSALAPGVDEYATAVAPLCDLLGDASDSAGGSLERLYVGGCVHRLWQGLADVMLVSTAEILGTTAMVPGGGRMEHAACYDAWDKLLDDPEAMIENVPVGRLHVLVDCLKDDVLGLADALAQQLVENGEANRSDESAALPDLAQATMAMRGAIDAQLEASFSVCGVLGDRDTQGLDHWEFPIVYGDCVEHAIALVGRVAKEFVYTEAGSSP